MKELTDLTDVLLSKRYVLKPETTNKMKPEQGQHKRTTEAKNPEMAVSV